MQSKPNWHAEAQALRATGLSYAEIGRRLGRTAAGIWKACNPEKARQAAAKSNADPKRKARKRAWDRANAERYLVGAKWEDAPSIPGLLPAWFHRCVVDFARVDIDDWDRLQNLRFHPTGKDYISASIDGKQAYLHHLVLGVHVDRASGMHTDHINRDTHDNRKANLRIVTAKENMANRAGLFAKAA